jgi:hypothetical protein
MAEPTPTRRPSSFRGKGLPTNRFSMRIPANYDAAHTATEKHGKDHWKVKVLAFIHSPAVEYTMMVLLLLDVCILFVELYLQGLYPTCSIIIRDAISCCPATYELDAEAAHSATADEHYNATDPQHFLLRFLEEASHSEHSSLCPAPTVEYTEHEAACDPHKYQTVHTVEDVLFIFTITILSAFFIENLIMIMVLQTAYFKQFFYVLDFCIVTISLALEIAFAVVREELLFALSGLLIFARVWRFVRIGHGLIEITADFQAKEKEALMDYAKELEEILKENSVALPVKSSEVKRIEHALHGTEHGEISKEEPIPEK